MRDAGRRALVAPRRRDNIVVSHPITTASEAKQGRRMSGNRHVGIPFACRPVSGKRFAKKRGNRECDSSIPVKSP
ncbi:conserved hypothetical protein [Burkholderia cenocepacia]|nr:conserved hypothetical protein [Burkholderia cenocepacia]